MEIKSERLLLKRLNHEDLNFLYKMKSNYLVCRYDDEEPNKDLIHKKYEEEILKMEEEPDKYFILLICILPDEIPIGEVHIKLNWSQLREWEVGFALHPDYWGKGYASEAVKLLIKYVFDNLNAHKVVGFCNANNKKSANLMERIGMKRDGTLREGRIWHDGWCDEFVYSILEKDYFALNKFNFTNRSDMN